MMMQLPPGLRPPGLRPGVVVDNWRWARLQAAGSPQKVMHVFVMLQKLSEALKTPQRRRPPPACSVEEDRVLENALAQFWEHTDRWVRGRGTSRADGEPGVQAAATSPAAAAATDVLQTCCCVQAGEVRIAAVSQGPGCSEAAVPAAGGAAG